MVRIIKDDEDTELLKDQIEKKKTDTISIRLPIDLMERFKDYCTNEDIRPNALLKEMISNKVNDKFIYRGSYKPVYPITVYLPSPRADYTTVIGGFDLTEQPDQYIENLMVVNVMVGNYDLLDVITLSSTNNKLDVWTKEGYKAQQTNNYEHEGLIIYEYEINNHKMLDEYDHEENIIYLIKVSKMNKGGYFCELITLNQAIGLAEYVENVDLLMELETIKHDKEKFNDLIENHLSKN